MMTLNDTFNDALTSSSGIRDNSSNNLKSLYCSDLWSNSNLRKAVLNTSCTNCKSIEYCYTCKGKIRNYEVKCNENDFEPRRHSTPKGNYVLKTVDHPATGTLPCNDNPKKISSCNYDYIDNLDGLERENQCIPSISRQIDSSFRQKFTDISFESNASEINPRRLRKSLKGIGCVVNFSLTEKSLKKRTQIQAFSISVMIVAIVLISLILVNFTTPNFTPATNVTSTIAVPTNDFNETSSAIINIYSDPPLTTDFIISDDSTTESPLFTTTQRSSSLNTVIAKIRKNIKTYPKDVKKYQDNRRPINVVNTSRFCSCQKNEVCMLNENTGTSICERAKDTDDPTGCGGLCALETEACQLVDKILGVRVCRLLSLVACSNKEWRCRNGLCVPLESRCDGSVQCYDRSDEIHCDCDLTKEFRCGHSISCFSNRKLCDGIIDCWDGYDEVNCTTECPEDQFTCTDGQCILQSRFCDGLADCGDGSDEPQGCGGACSSHEVQCKNKRCVPLASLCNGRDECGDETDELHCS